MRSLLSASDLLCLIFTRLYHSTLLITTPTMTLSLVNTSLKGQHLIESGTLESDENFVNGNKLKSRAKYSVEKLTTEC